MLLKTLLPFLCIPFFIWAMEEHNNPLAEKQKSCSLAWENVKKTTEFIICTEFVKQQHRPSRPEFQQAFKNLHATQAFKEYMKAGQPSFGENWPNFEQHETEKKI